MKVYLVHEGFDRGKIKLLGVCSTKEKAELVKASLLTYACKEYTIEEIELDSILDELKIILEREICNLRHCESLLNQINELGS